MQEKININLEVINSFTDNINSINDDLFVNVYYEGNLTTQFNTLIDSGLIPSYFDDLSINTSKINEYLSELKNLTNDYSDELFESENSISSKVNSKIDLNITIDSFTFGTIFLVHKTLYGIKNIVDSISSLASVFVSSSSSFINTLITNYANEHNVTTEDILSGENNDLLNEYANGVDNLGDLSTTLSEVDTLKLQSYLKDVFNGVYNTSSLAISLLLNYLNKVADNIKLTAKELLEDQKNSSLIKKEVSNVGNSLSGGDNEKTVLEKLNEYAEKNKLTLEQILSGENNQVLTSYIVKLDKVSDILTILKEMDPKMLPKYLNEIYTSNYSKDSTSLSIIFEYLELVSKNNGITLNSLLTDNNYTQILSDSLTKFSMQFVNK